MGRERQKKRVKSRVDELPEDVKKLLDDKLADVNYTYNEIANELIKMGFEISKSSVGRYALRQNAVAKRLREVAEQTKVIVEAAKDNNNFDAIGATTSMLTIGLAQKIATAQEEIDDMPIEKAAKIVIALERSAVYKEKFKIQYSKGIKDAIEAIKVELRAQLEREPDLLATLEQKANEIAARMEAKEG